MSHHRLSHSRAGRSPAESPRPTPRPRDQSSPGISRIGPTPSREDPTDKHAGHGLDPSLTPVGDCMGDVAVSNSSSSAAGMAGNRRGSGGVAARLSAVDYELVGLLHTHRVLTTPQLINLIGRPERTVDYRLSRLRTSGVVGRTRPYAASGSAPFYWWLTRRGARLVEGTSPANCSLGRPASVSSARSTLPEGGTPRQIRLSRWHCRPFHRGWIKSAISRTVPRV
jgi:hypothetical protein